MATLLLSQTALEQYKEVSEVINSIDVSAKHIRRNSLKGFMEQSFFHGKSTFGHNFIA